MAQVHDLLVVVAPSENMCCFPSFVGLILLHILAEGKIGLASIGINRSFPKLWRVRQLPGLSRVISRSSKRASREPCFFYLLASPSLLFVVVVASGFLRQDQLPKCFPRVPHRC